MGVGMRLYTRTGDTGETGLSPSGRIRKSSLRIEALGAVDEANAAVGMACALVVDGADLSAVLASVQHRLFDLGADLAQPGASGRVRAEHSAALETAIDELVRSVAPLKAFVLPGGTPAAAALHVARTVVRRAERAVVRLLDDGGEPADPEAIIYLNRLSDLLFAAARYANRARGDLEWEPGRPN